MARSTATSWCASRTWRSSRRATRNVRPQAPFAHHRGLASRPSYRILVDETCGADLVCRSAAFRLSPEQFTVASAWQRGCRSRVLTIIETWWGSQQPGFRRPWNLVSGSSGSIRQTTDRTRPNGTLGHGKWKLEIGNWIPAYAGMTTIRQCATRPDIPAQAGMTTIRRCATRAVIPAQAGIHATRCPTRGAKTVVWGTVPRR